MSTLLFQAEDTMGGDEARHQLIILMKQILAQGDVVKVGACWAHALKREPRETLSRPQHI